MHVHGEPIRSWDELNHRYEELVNEKDHWIFRGCIDSTWCLNTTLERVSRDLQIDFSELPYREAGLIRRFKRQYQHYKNQSPNEWDLIEWLSLMQHYGAPTRLLDFTHSFFVALYFALEGFSQSSAIWAVNQTRLDATFKRMHPDLQMEFDVDRRGLSGFKALFRRKQPLRFVCSINPYRLNERLVIQQGTFLCPGDVSSSFEDNLSAMFEEEPVDSFIAKLVLYFDLNTIKKSLIRLHRMNMNAATLFPGLDGFSRSLKTAMVFEKEILPPDPELDPTSSIV